MNEVIQEIKKLGYYFKNKQDYIEIYKINEKGYVVDDIYFKINNKNELYKVERNVESLIGEYYSLDFCLLNLYFKLNSSKFRLHNYQELTKCFSSTTNINEIKDLFTNIYSGNFVENNIFFNQEFSENNGFYVNLSNDENKKISIYFKHGDYYFLVAKKTFDKKHLILPGIIELIAKKNEFDRQLINLNINLDNYEYLQLFSNYSFGFAFMINEIEKKDRKL